MGGSVRAIEKGYIQKEIQNSAYDYQRNIEEKELAIVGVNEFQIQEPPVADILKVDESLEKKQTTRLKKLKESNPLDLITTEMALCDSKISGDQLLYFYQKFYMCDDILVKVDRASMAHSLEVRAPFLDPDVVAYVNSLPYALKLKGKTSKYILKKAAETLLPKNIIHRPKKGFGIPVAGWLKNELTPLLRATLNKKRIAADGFFNFATIDTCIKEHLSGKRNNRKQLFSLLMLHLWLDRYC